MIIIILFAQIYAGGQIWATVFILTNSLSPMLIVFIICNFGNELTNYFEDVAENFYGMDWHMLPLDMQKHWPMMIALGQKDVELRTFGSNCFNRVLFMKVYMNIPRNQINRQHKPYF